MKKGALLATNLVVAAIIVLGFIITSVISYKSNIGIFERDIEHVLELASDGIYSKIDHIFTQPISVSLTMANDSLLKEFLNEENEQLVEDEYVLRFREYLCAYKDKYLYDSVFLVSTKTNRYYHYNGIDRVLDNQNPENTWYYNFLEDNIEYSLNVDNDEARDNIITVFVNCKIKDKYGNTLGVVGVGLKVDYIKQILGEYNNQFGVLSALVDTSGEIKVSSDDRQFSKPNILDIPKYQDIQEELLHKDQISRNNWYCIENENGYVSSKYIPNLDWHLIVDNDSTKIMEGLHAQLMLNIVVIIVIIAMVLLSIITLMRRYNKKIVNVTLAKELEYQYLLYKTTEGLYDFIYEIDVTNNRAVGKKTIEYFKTLIDCENPLYDDITKYVAEKQIKEDQREDYLQTFSAENILQVYSEGKTEITRDFLFGTDYYRWMKICCRIFYWNSDDSVRMVMYVKDIQEEVSRENILIERSLRDSRTHLYNKRTTEEMIEKFLVTNSKHLGNHALIMFDIDDFKEVNDTFGHAFGDSMINDFAAEIRAQFRDSDIVGRIGGDEFIVFMKNYGSVNLLKDKLERFYMRIKQKSYNEAGESYISASVGVALFPEHASSYAELYKRADTALYNSKKYDKGYFSIFSSIMDEDGGENSG